MLGIGLAIVSIVLGIAYIVRPTWKRDQVEKRIADGDDRFFEEQRSYQTYTGWKKVKFNRLIGGLMVCAGIVALVVNFVDL
jgi:uncharacterized protein YjeT (DUF2065 family)